MIGIAEKSSGRFFRAGLVLLALVCIAGDVLAARGRGGHGGRTVVRSAVFVGVPVFRPWYSPAPYPYYATVPLYADTAPPVYIEQSTFGAVAGVAYWYYCETAGGYYPHVEACPSGWQRIASQPLDNP